MGKPLKKGPSSGKSELVCGLFSKKEAAHLIASGAQHLHSSTLAARDTCAKLTQQFLDTGKIGEFPWEIYEGRSEHTVKFSSERYDFIHGLAKRTGLVLKRDLKERLETTTEELLTNAIYHSYVNPDGTSQYPRTQPVALSSTEIIEVAVAFNQDGIYLRVKDRGGNLTFNDICKSFTRCYAGGAEQIQNKQSGAGLGIYMVFELVTHLKIISDPGVATTISCWLSAGATYDPDAFSFNFFVRR